MSKYNAKKVEYKGIVFDSTVECDYYQYLERNLGDEYDYIELQPRYELIPKVNKQRKQNTSQTLHYGKIISCLK